MSQAPRADDEVAAPADPAELGEAIDRLSFGSRRNAHAPAAVVAQLLREGELVSHALMGRSQGHDAIAVLTNQRLIVADARRWNPSVQEMRNPGSADIDGWADWRSATIQFVRPDATILVDEIADVDAAKAFMETLKPGSSS